MRIKDMITQDSMGVDTSTTCHYYFYRKCKGTANATLNFAINRSELKGLK